MSYDYYGFGGYNKNQIKAFTELTKNEGRDPNDLYEVRPDATSNGAEIIKNMPPEYCANIIPDSFAGETGRQLASALSLEQLAEIGAYGDIFLQQAVKLALEKEIQRNPASPELKAKVEYMNYSPAWQI